MREVYLERCPFCGSKGLLDISDNYLAAVFCTSTNCGAEMVGISINEVISNWKIRHGGRGCLTEVNN